MINFIDIFSGCGGFSEGFKSHSDYRMLGAVEWEKPQVENLRNRLKNHWGYEDAEQRVIRFDIQRTEELLNGWDDEVYGSHSGLKSLVGQNKIDLIIGGPPCQAYSLASRIGYGNKMKNDYRNFLFESYMNLVKEFKPKMFVFENVLGMLSAKVGEGVSVVEMIVKDMKDAGYIIIDDLRKHAVFNVADYGVPQNRKRLIIVGVREGLYDDPQQFLHEFYQEIMPRYKEVKMTVQEAIGDLDPLYPVENVDVNKKKVASHTLSTSSIANHNPRYHNARDIEIFRLLAKDIEDGENKYVSTESLRELYTKMTGKESKIHKYHVLRRNEPSNTIPAHLYKDGLRHIHPDSKQARSITVREAARLQSFPDDYVFISSAGDNYKMIGNAVPPKFAKKVAHALLEIFIKQLR